MKLGTAFVVFSGLEFLEPALRNTRPFCSYIVILYSLQSNDGRPAPLYLLPLLEELKRKKLFDDMVEFAPQKTGNCFIMAHNNSKKRELGRQMCLNKGCDYFMVRDCDEFYNVQQFQNILPKLTQYDFTIAPIVEYFEKPTKKAQVISGLSVPVIHKVGLPYVDTERDWPVLIDKERVVQGAKNIYVCKPEELIMHHFTSVRFNMVELKRKFEGHPHYTRLGMKFTEFVKETRKCAAACLDCTDEFGIVSYWENGFKLIGGKDGR